MELAHGYNKNIALYRKYFGINPKFNASSSTLSFDNKYLLRRIENADKQLLDILSEHLIQADINFVDEIPIYVERLVRQQLNSESLSIHNVAKKLNMSERTLQRIYTRIHPYKWHISTQLSSQILRT